MRVRTGPATDEAKRIGLTARLKHAYDVLRRRDYDVPPRSPYGAPTFR